MFTRKFLHIAHNFGAPTRITTLALTKCQFFLSVTDLFSGNIIAQRSWPPLTFERGFLGGGELRGDRHPRLRNPLCQHGLDGQDIALSQSAELAQLAPRIIPELITARRVVEFVLKEEAAMLLKELFPVKPRVNTC